MGIAEAQRWNTLGNVIMRFPSFTRVPVQKPHRWEELRKACTIAAYTNPALRPFTAA